MGPDVVVYVWIAHVTLLTAISLLATISDHYVHRAQQQRGEIILQEERKEQEKTKTSEHDGRARGFNVFVCARWTALLEKTKKQEVH